MTASDDIDVVVIGSGMGGASFAAGLAPSGARILILERGERLVDRPETRDGRAIYQRGVFRPKETWFDAAGAAFNPGNYYYVGGNTKLYGAVLIRYRAQAADSLECFAAHADCLARGIALVTEQPGQQHRGHVPLVHVHRAQA